MLKMPTKLALRRETLRTLSTIKLARVIGGQGDGAPLGGDLTHENGCPAAMAGDATHDKDCPSGFALKA